MAKTKPKTKLQDFNDEIAELVPYIGLNKTRLLVSATNLTQLQAETGPPIPPNAHDNGMPGTWNYLYPRHQDAATKNTPDTTSLGALRKTMKTTFTGIWNDIPKSALTPADYSAFKRKIKDTKPTPSPDPSGHPPVINKEEKKSGSGLVVIRILNPETPKSKAKAHSSWEYEVHTAIIDTPVPASRQATPPTPAPAAPVFGIQDITGKSLNKIPMDVDNNAGRTLLIKARCRNPQGKVSEWSNVLSVVIS